MEMMKASWYKSKLETQQPRLNGRDPSCVRLGVILGYMFQQISYVIYSFKAESFDLSYLRNILLSLI